jgi:hypothetical protein
VTTILPPPPFDPELGAALTALSELLPPKLTPDLIPAMRESGVIDRPSDDDLCRDCATTRTSPC